MKRVAWADPRFCLVQARTDGARVMLPSWLRQPCRIVAGEAPGVAAGMGDHNDGCQPVEIGFAKAVEMNDVWFDGVLKIFEKLPGVVKILTSRILPFEGEWAFYQANASVAQH